MPAHERLLRPRNQSDTKLKFLLPQVLWLAPVSELLHSALTPLPIGSALLRNNPGSPRNARACPLGADQSRCRAALLCSIRVPLGDYCALLRANLAICPAPGSAT